MNFTMTTNCLAAILIAMMLSVASAHEHNFAKSSKRSNLTDYGMMSGHGHHKGSKKGSKRGGHHHHSKKHHPKRPEEMDFGDVEELLRIHQIKAALQEEKDSRSAGTVSSWRSSSSASSASSSSDGSVSSTLDDSTQEGVTQVVEEKVTMKLGEEEGIARMEKEIP